MPGVAQSLGREPSAVGSGAFARLASLSGASSESQADGAAVSGTGTVADIAETVEASQYSASSCCHTDRAKSALVNRLCVGSVNDGSAVEVFDRCG
jgi:hypothetical protein